MFKISKKEAMWLAKHGVPWNDNGISHTIARHRRTYYLCESVRNMKLFKEFHDNEKVVQQSGGKG